MGPTSEERIRAVQSRLREYALALSQHGCAPIPPAYIDGLRYLARELEDSLAQIQQQKRKE